MSDRNARRCRYRPPHLLTVRRPQLDAVTHVGDVVEVGVRQLSFIYPPVEAVIHAPRALGFDAQAFQEAERVEAGRRAVRLSSAGAWWCRSCVGSCG